MPCYKMDMHTHTLVSGHAYSTIKEMAAAAAEKGLELLGLTEHGPALPGSCHELYFSKLDIIPRKQFGIELMFGAEVNILDYEGHVDLSEKYLQRLDLCLAGIHPFCYTPGTVEENTRAVVHAIENPYVDIISHPDDSGSPLDYPTVVRAAKENHVLLEVNNHSLESPGRRQNPIVNCRAMLRCCKELSVPVLVSSDAHIEYAVGSFDTAARILAEEAFPPELIINNSIPAFREFLAENRRIRERKLQK